MFVENINIFLAFAFIYFFWILIDPSSKSDGRVWPWFQHLGVWKNICALFQGSVVEETKLDNKKQYIFASFPHGAYTAQHVLTMTNGVGFFSNVYSGDRRDLVASVLFFIPVLREMLLWLGCVDASASTAKLNLNKGRSILIFVGGEKEQLLAEPGRYCIYVKERKGFVKLSLTSGAPIGI
jgi:hypothetical protein